ncbi:MAG: Rossmann fold nucleotide-binding protein, partial [Myxococcota bacterium]
MLELDTLDLFRRWIDEGADRPAAVCQALDLTGQPKLETEPFAGSVFLGCTMTPQAAAALVESGALVIHDVAARPFPMH